MKLNKLSLAVGLLGLALSQQVFADVSGTVYRDLPVNGSSLNTYGVKDANELGVSGITVTVTDSTGAVVGSPVTTDSNGAWAVTGTSGDVRVEFSNIPSYLESSPVNSDSNTTVQFISDGATANLGLHNPDDFTHTTNPEIFSPIHSNGDGSLGGTSASIGVFPHWSYNNNQNSPLPNNFYATNQDAGSLWGVAYRKDTDSIFVSSVLRRHMGFGPAGISGIYTVTGARQGSPNFQQWLKLSDLGIDVGVDTRDQADNCNRLTADANKPSHDIKVYENAAKMGIGDIDLSEDGKTLYAVNLNNKELVAVDTDSKTLKAGFPKAIPDPGCANGDYRPWGLGIHDGNIYVGVVCSAETSQSTNDLKAHIMQFDGNSFSSVLNFPLNYERAYTIWNEPAEWNPWIVGTTWRDDSYPQPVLSDIEFDIDGSLILGFIDRYGLMTGNNNYTSDCSSTMLSEGHSGGEILRACPNGAGGWQLESNASCGGVTTAGANGNPASGPGGGEYYWKDELGFGLEWINHREITVGGLGFVRGSGEVVSSAFDPKSTDSGGILFLNNTTGDLNKVFEVYPNEEYSGDPNNIPLHMGKSGGIGDIEFLSDPAPLEIGNRVWDDANGNGIQDAGEAGIDGVAVTLNCGGSDFTQTTANGGEYLFTDANVAGGIPRNTQCTISVPMTVNSKNLTTSNAATDEPLGSNPDTATGSFTFTTGNAGQNNHSYDIGYKNAPTCTLTASASVSACTNVGSDTDSSNDTYTVTITASGTNASSAFNYSSSPAGISGTGINFTASPYTTPAIVIESTDSPLTLTVTDSVDNSCSTVITPDIAEPVTCSPAAPSGRLKISKVVTGKPSPFTSPTYNIAVDCSGDNFDQVVNIVDGASQTITGIPENTTCIVTEPSQPAAPAGYSYGNATFAPASASTAPGVTIAANTTVSVAVTNPLTQNAVCSISSTVGTTCNDNNTPSDASDDTFSYTINAAGTNAGASFSISGDDTQAGLSYGVDHTFQPFLISAGNLSLTLTDVDDSSCQENPVIVTAPASCSNVIPQVDLELTKTANPTSAMSGDMVVYTLTVTNTSSTDATGVEVTDVLPAGVTYSSNDGGATENAGTITWAVGNVAANSSAVLNITVVVD